MLIRDENKCDILLISPPVGNFAQVHPAILLLTAYLQAAGIKAKQRDLAIDCFQYFHAHQYLSKLKTRELQKLEESLLNQDIDRKQAVDASAKIRLILLLEQASNSIEAAKSELKDPSILDHPQRLAAALRVIKDAGRCITAAHPGQHFNFQEFRIDGAFDEWSSLKTVLTDGTANLLLEYLETTCLPPATCLGISITYPDQLLPALCIAAQWRSLDPATRIIVGGSYVTRMAETFANDARWFELFDYIVLNDGEEALLALVKQDGHPADPTTIPNLCYLDGTVVRKSTTRSRTNLKNLPTPMLTYDGIDLSAYVAPMPVVALPITRGCYWGKCTFCNISNQAEEPYRVRPSEKVVLDIKALQEIVGTSYFDFCIDSYHPSGLSRLSQALIDAELGINWNAEVLLDAGFTAERLQLMEKSGCRHLRFGFESANSSTLDKMKKRNDRAVVLRILHDCNTLDIKVSLMSIIGFPTESKEEAWKTVEFYLEHSKEISFVTLHRFSVSAGSPIMNDPSLCGIELERVHGLVQPRYRYRNNNVGCMSASDVEALLPVLEEIIRQKYPQHAEIHTVGIGGWLTFLACCRHRTSFFKLEPDTDVEGPARPALLTHQQPLGSDATVVFEFDVPTVEAVAKGKIGQKSISKNPHVVMMDRRGQQLIVVPTSELPIV